MGELGTFCMPAGPPKDSLHFSEASLFFLPKSARPLWVFAEPRRTTSSCLLQHHHHPLYILACSPSSSTLLLKASTVCKATTQVLVTFSPITVRKLKKNDILFLIIWTVKRSRVAHFLLGPFALSFIFREGSSSSPGGHRHLTRGQARGPPRAQVSQGPP